MFVRRRTCLNASPNQRDQSSGFSQLLDRACNGESEALSILYLQFLNGIFDYIAIRVPNHATAEVMFLRILGSGPLLVIGECVIE